jgi:hypothetical protein
VFNDRVNNLENANDVHKRVGERFYEQIEDPERREQFKNRLNEFNKMSNEDRKTATANLIKEFSPNNTLNDDAFNKAWNKAEENVSNASNLKSFKDKIDTFTNGRNERLCYRYSVEEVKQNLRQLTGIDNFENFEVRGTRVFEDMKLSGYDRLNRVMKTYGKTNEDLFKTAIRMANDPLLRADIKNASDLVSIAEYINRETVGEFFFYFLFLT